MAQRRKKERRFDDDAITISPSPTLLPKKLDLRIAFKSN
jgi:hypothetical protein